MKLEDQVCSLELAKKLKELGVKQESLFYYDCDEDGEASVVIEYDPHILINQHAWRYSAFTVAELGEMLPIRYPGHGQSLVCSKWYEKWFVEYHTTFEAPLCRIEERTEADARAKMLIHLLENNLITL